MRSPSFKCQDHGHVIAQQKPLTKMCVNVLHGAPRAPIHGPGLFEMDGLVKTIMSRANNSPRGGLDHVSRNLRKINSDRPIIWAVLGSFRRPNCVMMLQDIPKADLCRASGMLTCALASLLHAEAAALIDACIACNK